MNGSFLICKQWNIRYRNLTFGLKPFSFKHTGLFPEQAVNWDYMSMRIKEAKRPVKVLNLFAYHGRGDSSMCKGGSVGYTC